IRSQFAQRAVQRAEYEVAYASRVAKANFVFCRMYVYVDLPSVELEIQHEYWVATVEQDVAIRLLHRVPDDPILHRSAVHVKELLVGVCARVRRQTDPTVQSEAVVRFVDRHGRLGEAVAEQLRYAAESVRDGRG